MHKALLLLGLLLNHPRSGYELHRIVRAHGELYTDLKKANLYYLLDRLAREGYLRVKAEPGARGPRGERLVYSLTKKGRQRFIELVREILRTFEPAHTGVDVAVVFLAELPRSEALTLLLERHKIVSARREAAAAELSDFATRGPLPKIAADHLMSLIDAELKWIDRSMAHLREVGWGNKRRSVRCLPETETHGEKDLKSVAPNRKSK